MNLIKSVKISNFQSHKNTLIDFAGQGCLTVITGPSDSGKSAVIRAMRWLFYNTPQGSDFITVGEDKCVVSILFEGGTVVERLRTRGGVNRYTVNGEVFEGFGTSVPLEVQQATGIKKLQIGDMNFLLNLSEQLDGPFLGKSVPGSARAKVLGKLAGTEEIDFAGKELGTDIYRAKRQQEGLEADIGKITDNLKEYAWIPEREIQVDILQAIVNGAKTLQDRAQTLQSLYNDYQRILNQVCWLGDEVERLLQVDEGLSYLVDARNEISKQNVLTCLRKDYRRIMGQIAEAEEIIIMAHDVLLAELVANGVQEDLAKVKELNTLRILHHQLNYQKEINHARVLEIGNLNEVIVPLVLSAEETKNLHNTLSQLFSDHSDAVYKFVTSEDVVYRLGILGMARDYIAIATGQNVSLQNTETIQKELTKADKDKDYWHDLLSSSATEVRLLESEYIDTMAALGKCPTCGGDIDIEKLKEAI